MKMNKVKTRWTWIYWLMCACQVVFSATTYGLSGERRKSVILISVDTLRADHLSCYGYRKIQTTAIDSIAKGGTLFTQVNAQVPLTLPSHVSLFTSTYPFSNGVEDNGEVLRPNATTLAGVLKVHGYSTGAFIGGFALDRRFGLNQGFDVYDSPFGTILTRPGEAVTKSAEAWLDKKHAAPFFLFLHLYDLHTPYRLSVEAQKRFAGDGYDAELLYVDRTLGQFLNFLRKKDLFKNTLIVFISDHGESLGEHGENTHGYFIYQSTLHVPLIFHWPDGSGLLPARVDEPGSLLDVAPTILQFLNILVPSQFEGTSQFVRLRSNTRHAHEMVYSESLYAHNHYRCSPLRSLRDGRYKYIDAPIPELYDLDRDPRETKSLYSHHKALGASFHEQLRTLLASYPTAHASSLHAISPKIAKQLSALGYLVNTSTYRDDSNSGVDPKDRLVQYQETQRAISLAYSGRLNEAVSLLKNVLAKTPDLHDVRDTLGLFQQKLGLHEQAAKNFREVLKEDPSNLLAHYNLAVSYYHLNQIESSIRELRSVLAIMSDSIQPPEPITTQAEELLGTIWMQQKDYGRARAEFEQLMTLAPHDYVAHYNLGWIVASQGNPQEGIRHLQVAVEIEPGSAEAHNALGSLYLGQGDLSKAQRQLTEAIHLSPGFALAHYNLGILLLRENNKEGAVSEFNKTLKLNPNFHLAREAVQQVDGTR